MKRNDENKKRVRTAIGEALNKSITEIVERTFDDFVGESKTQTQSRKLADEAKNLMVDKIPLKIDFDGTMVRHSYPDIGEENKPCVEVLKRWIKDYNVGIILYTSRDETEDVEKWFKDRGIELWGVNENPTQHTWCKSPKIYGYCIDDMNVAIPLLDDDEDRPRVDWKKIDEIFSPRLEKLHNVLKNKEDK